MTSPWHLWGSTQNVQVGPFPVVTAFEFPIQQIANIEYFRPDTWSFFLGVTVSVIAKPTVGPSDRVIVDFAFQFGVGRSNQRWTRLGHFFFDLSAAGAGVTILRQATELELAPIAPVTLWGTVPAPQFMRQVTAQSIQCQAEIFGTAEVGNVYGVEATAYFAPFHHQRPEWWLGKFTEEVGGR
jgi:hypothetical protein